MENIQLPIQNIEYFDGKLGIALDIDETLAWTNGYWFKEMQALFGNPESLTIHQMIEKYRYVQFVPYWQTDDIFAWLDVQRNSNKVQEILPPIKEAQASVWKIHSIIPIKLYLTGRPQCVLDGTRRWLSLHNFPEVDIIARPMDVIHSSTNEWKAKALYHLYPNILGIIDDNPALVDFLPKLYKGTVFLYDSSNHPRKDVNVVPCRTWNNVYEEIKVWCHSIRMLSSV